MKMITNGITFDISNYIPLGHNNAVSRKYLSNITGLSDRTVRQLIEKSDQPIINLGYGYFIPNMDDEYDRSELRDYCRQEQARANAIQEKLINKFSELTPELALI